MGKVNSQGPVFTHQTKKCFEHLGSLPLSWVLNPCCCPVLNTGRGAEFRSGLVQLQYVHTHTLGYT